MQYVEFDKIGNNFQSFWNHDDIGRCIVFLSAPKKKIIAEKQFKNYDDLVKYWTDGEEILKRYRLQFENTYFLGDSFPLVSLNLGASGHAGYFNGVNYKFDSRTVWFFPVKEDEELYFSKDNFFYKKTTEIAKYLVSEGKGDFIVSMPDIAGNLDALAHLRGSENVLVNMIIDPEKVKSDLLVVQKAWETMTNEVFGIIKENNYGGSSIGWMGTYAKGLHAQLQSDMSVMLSQDNFSEFVFEELNNQANFLEYPIYHFDGIEQERHLDKLLSIKKIRMIQYTCVAGQPSPVEKIDILKRIQKSGKLLLVIVKPEWVKPLLENLSSRGLFLKVEADSPEQADDLYKIVCDYSKTR